VYLVGLLGKLEIPPTAAEIFAVLAAEPPLDKCNVEGLSLSLDIAAPEEELVELLPPKPEGRLYAFP
jgi:hypothetical protein